MTKSLSLLLSGGLGNQLFQVASAISLSTDLGYELALDTSAFKTYKKHPLLVSEIFHDIPVRTSAPWFYLSLKESSPSFDHCLLDRLRSLSLFSSSTVVLSGYLQSLSYFSHYLPSISLRINDYCDALFSTDLVGLRKHLSSALGVHIRRGDKLSALNQSIYGSSSLQTIKSNIINAFSSSSCDSIVLFGDDPCFLSLVANELNSVIPAVSFPNLSDFSAPLFDIYSLSLCKSLFLSNSTFALWSAYISKSKLVFYPFPFYPFPRHESVESHLLEDLILPHWISYDSWF